MPKIDEIALRVGRNINVYPWGESKDFYIKFAHTLLADPELLAELSKDAEPVAFMYQHEDTGIVGFVDQYQLDNGFEKLNPRLQVIGPLFTRPAMPDQSEIEQPPLLAAFKAGAVWAWNSTGLNEGLTVSDDEAAQAIRSGKWREYL